MNRRDSLKVPGVVVGGLTSPGWIANWAGAAEAKTVDRCAQRAAK